MVFYGIYKSSKQQILVSIQIRFVYLLVLSNLVSKKF